MSLLNDAHAQRLIQLIQKVQGGVSELKSSLGNYALKSEVPDTSTFAKKSDLNGLVSSSTLSSTLNSYATQSWVNTKVSGVSASVSCTSSNAPNDKYTVYFCKYGKLVIAGGTVGATVPAGYRPSSTFLANCSYYFNSVYRLYGDSTVTYNSSNYYLAVSSSSYNIVCYVTD